MTLGFFARWWLFYGLLLTLAIYSISQMGPIDPMQFKPAKPSKELQTCRIN